MKVSLSVAAKNACDKLMCHPYVLLYSIVVYSGLSQKCFIIPHGSDCCKFLFCLLNK